MLTELGHVHEGTYGVIKASAELRGLLHSDEVRLAVIDLASSPSTTDLQLFSGLIALRAQAVSPERRPPLTAPDFAGTHYIFWIERDGHVTPIGGYRTVSAARCKEVGLGLPVFPAIHDAGAQDHERAVNEILETHPADKIAFSSHLLIVPGFRKTRYSVVMHELVAATVCHDLGRRFSIGLGWATGEMNKFFTRIGYKELSYKQEKLPSLPCNYADTRLTLISIQKPSDYAAECLAKHQPIVDQATSTRLPHP